MVQEAKATDKFSDRESLKIRQKSTSYHHSWKQRAENSMKAKFEE